MRHYPLSTTSSVQTLYPYGVIVDSYGMVWFTESGTNQFGRLDPKTGRVQLFAVPDRHALLIEIASDGQGMVWVTMLAENAIPRLDAAAGHLVYYRIPTPGTLPLGLAMDTNQDLWFTVLDKIGVLYPESGV
jgi:virginiamycin B lyase